MLRIRHVFFLLLFVAGCNFGSGPAPIEIGHVSDKTRLDRAGAHAELGIRLALAELSKYGALATAFGGRKVQVRHTDTRGQLDAFESQAVRLDSVNRCVAVLGGVSPAETSRLANGAVPLLTFQGQPIAGASTHIFYIGMTPIRQGAALAKVVAEDAKLSHVAVIVDDKRSEAVAAADSFQKTLNEVRKDAKPSLLRLGFSTESSSATSNKSNGTARSSEPIDWSRIVERMKGQGTQVVVFAGSVQDFNNWHRVLRKEGEKLKPKLVFAGPDGSHALLDVGGDSIDVLLASAFDVSADKASTFVKAYRDMHQADPDVHAALAYDGLRILVEAMKKTPAQLTSEKLREELLKTKDFEGVTGALTFTSERMLTRPVFVQRMRGGVLTQIKVFPAE